MAMTLEETRAYSRGYSAGVKKQWPLHRPPEPPNELVASLMNAALNLRDCVDGELATIEQNDPWQKTLGNPMDALDQAMEAVGIWLTNPPPQAESERKEP